MFGSMFKRRVEYSVASATPFAVQLGLMTQHTGMMMWAFFISFVYHFITARKTMEV